jgi:PleD family two-component response regulator
MLVLNLLYTMPFKMVRFELESLRERMENSQLRVLIVSPFGAHQKAIQALCASIPQIIVIDTAFNTPQAFDMISKILPDLIILGANLTESRVCEFLSQVGTLPNPPYCIALTVSEFGGCFDNQLGSERIIPTTTFAHRLPEILTQVSAQ